MPAQGDEKRPSYPVCCSFHAIPPSAELSVLSGCYLLPLADGTLSKLKYSDTTHAESAMYYVASDTELELFKFGSYLLVSLTIALGSLLDSGKFNFAKLSLCNVKKLLEMKSSGSAPPNKDEDAWRTAFWKCWNNHVDYNLPTSKFDTFTTDIRRNVEPIRRSDLLQPQGIL